MLRSRRHRFLLAAPIALALLVAPALAFAADDDDAPPAPTRIRIKVEKKVAKKQAGPDAPDANPMEILHHWFAGHLEKDAPGGEGLEARLESWFAAGQDAPMAGLRDAFKAHGWNAKMLSAWLSGHAGAAGRGMPGHGMLGAMRGPHSNRARSFTAQGPTAHGWFGAPGQAHGAQTGMGQGPMGGRNFTPGGHAQGPHGGACPNCGQGAPRAQTWFGRMPNRAGPRMGRFGMRRIFGPFGMRGPAGLRGFRGGPAGRGGGQGMPRAQSTSRAYIMWNDGHGWQRREIAPGAGFGGGQGPAGHGHAHGSMGHGPMGPGPMGRGPTGPGQAGQGRAPGHALGGMDLQQLEKLLEMLRSIQSGAGKPGAAGQPGQPGSAGGMDPAKLQEIMKLYREMGAPTNGANMQVWPQGDAASFLEFLRKLQPGNAAAQPKRVRIKVSKPKKLEEVVEEVEIK